MFKKLDALYEKMFGITFTENSKNAWNRMCAICDMVIVGAKKFPALVKEAFQCLK
jgi:hypothetical protein